MTASTGEDSRGFVVVANRLPIDSVTEPDGTVIWRRSPGGLVSALEPIMQRNNGAWVGWPGAPDLDVEPFDEAGMRLVPIRLSSDDIEQYYEGFANASLWPLYHDVVAPPEFHREWWERYVTVNHRFAETTAAVAAKGAIVWIHDYQLQLVPEILRAQRPDLRIGFFLHIPFPPAELFNRLPWRQRILRGMLGADLVGFQRPGAATNFLHQCRRLLGLSTQRERVSLPDGRTVRARAFPISIDVGGFAELARDPRTQERAKQIREEVGNPRRVLLGVDRLDYTKGITERIRAFSELLDDGDLTTDEAVFVQLAIPSRERVEQYRILRDEVELQVGRINGTHAKLGHPAVTYLHNAFDRRELAALYRAADVMVVTPLRDGMNLVAKEYVACRFDHTGRLVLSEFAGAADELKHSILVNPYDLDGLKQKLLDAIRMDDRDANRRMRNMRKVLVDNDVDSWASSFLDALDGEVA